jgi:hypothetical protein
MAIITFCRCQDPPYFYILSFSLLYFGNFFFRYFQLLQELLKSLNFENLAGVQVTAPVTANAQSDFRRPRRDQRPRAPRAPRAETEVAAQA